MKKKTPFPQNSKTQNNLDYTSFGHDEGYIEYAQPHEPAYVEPVSPYLPVDEAYHYPVPPPAHAQYGPPPYIEGPHSHITNYISTDRKGKSYSSRT